MKKPANGGIPAIENKVKTQKEFISNSVLFIEYKSVKKII